MVAETASDVRRPCLSWGFAVVRTACCLCGRADGPALMSGQHRPEPAVGGLLCQIRAKVSRPGPWPGSRSGPCELRSGALGWHRSPVRCHPVSAARTVSRSTLATSLTPIHSGLPSAGR